jgi:hypothetical protein
MSTLRELSTLTCGNGTRSTRCPTSLVRNRHTARVEADASPIGFQIANTRLERRCRSDRSGWKVYKAEVIECWLSAVLQYQFVGVPRLGNTLEFVSSQI